jgi:hypothetical protein
MDTSTDATAQDTPEERQDAQQEVLAPEPTPDQPPPAERQDAAEPPGADVTPAPVRVLRQPVQLAAAAATPKAVPPASAPVQSPQQRAAATKRARAAAAAAAAAPGAAAAAAIPAAAAAAIGQATGAPTAQVQLIAGLLQARASAIGQLVCGGAGWAPLTQPECDWLDATYPDIHISGAMAKVAVPLIIFGPRLWGDPRFQAWWQDRQRTQRIAALADIAARRGRGERVPDPPWYAEHVQGEMARMRQTAAAPAPEPPPPPVPPAPPAADQATAAVRRPVGGDTPRTGDGKPLPL